MQAFENAYVDAMLFAETDDDGEPLDKRFDRSDLAPEALERIKRDCEAFYAANSDVWQGEWIGVRERMNEDDQAGHDFWLTRNRHGAGFWDGDWTEPAATKLTEAAHAFGECSPYVGDDGLIYLY